MKKREGRKKKDKEGGRRKRKEEGRRQEEEEGESRMKVALYCTPSIVFICVNS
jgi:hypothetical protein